MHLSNKTLIICLFLCTAPHVFFGQDYITQYENAKKAFHQKKYNLAMTAFEPLIDQDNLYSPYASFYYAIAAYYRGLTGRAKSTLLHLRKRYPTWTQSNEIIFWLGKIYFNERQYFQAMKVLKKCRGKTIQKDIRQLKLHYLKRINDVETLRMMNIEYPNDRIVARMLLIAITNSTNANIYAQLSNSLQARFHLTEDDMLIEDNTPTKDDADAPFPEKAIFKSQYTVSLIFPFLIKKLTPNLVPKINQNILDLYMGMTMAQDTLSSQDINIDLKLYDTQRDTAVLKHLLTNSDLRNSDILVGPLFANQIPAVRAFSKKHHIHTINPVSGNAKFIDQNPYAMLYLPEHKTVGRRSAEWIYTHTHHKKCMVFFGNKSKDISIAQGFLERAKELGLSISHLERISQNEAVEIFTMLTRATQFDQFGNPVQFRLKKYSIESIFVASDNPIIYTKVISAVDTRGDSIMIVGHQSWLNNKIESFETYERLKITLAAPSFYPMDHPRYQFFQRQFIDRYGTLPNEYAKIGYDFMLFMGHGLDQYGTEFPEKLKNQGFMEGYISAGYNYRNARSNQFVSFIYFNNGVLQIANDP